jgi:hypothetical protein
VPDDPDIASGLDLLLRENEALRRVLTFARRHGGPHTALAMHAALPLGLTPDLLHLLRVNFVPDAPWVAEADLLLSPLCGEVGGDIYEMDARVREELLDLLSSDPEFGPPYVRQVAEFLYEYAARSLASAADDPELRDFFEAQAWVGLAYAHPQEGARALAAALGARMSEENAPGVARVVRMTQALTAPLYMEDGVLMYAAALEKLGEGDEAGARRLFAVLGPADESPEVGGVRLPAPATLLSAPGPAEPPRVEEPEPRPPVADRAREADEYGWTGDEWEALILSTNYQRLTPVVGPGVTAGLLPSPGMLARSLAEESQYPWRDSSDLSRVAQFVAVERGPKYLESYLRDMLHGKGGQNFEDPNNAYENLARLPLPVYVTTGFDDFLEEALRREGKRPVRQVCGWRRGDRLNRSAVENYDHSPTPDEPLVFHLYGHVEERGSLVLTADDNLDWLLSVSENRGAIPPRVEQCFASASLLFAGFSARDTGFRVLRQFLRPYMRRNAWAPHVITQLSPAAEDDPRAESGRGGYLEAYFSRERLRIFWGTAAEFLRELYSRLEKHS